jgi:predicted glutamine amidotransferase
MCIIVFKPSGKKLPKRKKLLKCWENNPDGAGYMLPVDNQVVIKKGFMDYSDFIQSLQDDYKKYGEETPIVMHFRISTQGGVKRGLTHPFPFTNNMEDMKKTRCRCQLGIAHNGVIDLTTENYWRRKEVDYNDTMKFISDYLTLIIKSKDWYKNKDKLKLIELLISGSRLAIMDGNGHTELIGDWIEDNGLFYSNAYYKQDRVRYTYSTTKTTIKENGNDTTRSIGFTSGTQGNDNTTQSK